MGSGKIVELFAKRMFEDKGYKVARTSHIDRAGYDLVLEKCVKVEIKSTHFKNFSIYRDGNSYIRRNGGYNETIDFLIVFQLLKDITIWVFPSEHGGEKEYFKKPKDINSIEKYKNNLQLVYDCVGKKKGLPANTISMINTPIIRPLKLKEIPNKSYSCDPRLKKKLERVVKEFYNKKYT